MPSLRSLLIPVAALTVFLFPTYPTFAAAPPPLASILESIRAKYNLPALAGAIFTTDGLLESAAVGVRREGTNIPVTTNDLWHLGSDTKMMTATLAGSYVAENKLSWDSKIISFFPDITASVPPAMRDITLSQVLSHQAGLPENLDWQTLSTKGGSLTTQRLNAARIALTAPAFIPGTYHYSNTDYVVVAAILEQLSGKPWETLIRDRLFKPLGMTSAGFGGLGTPGKIDQPWPHIAGVGPMPSNGPSIDNPPVMYPAGAVHCSIHDWSIFLIDQLRGATGRKALLPQPIYTAIQSNSAGHAQYGFGWNVCDRPWAGGKALNHTGSNTMNFCNCWLAPAKKFGVLVCTNEGGGKTFEATDEAVAALIQRYLANPAPAPSP
jgi:CubicO group peptidase (beta-lactamase class C family)